VPGFNGFAVGRTDFWEPLVLWRDKKTTLPAAGWCPDIRPQATIAC
jgi:hypothetical protein